MSKIEKAAAGYFENLILRCQKLDTNVASEDSVPLTDGMVRIYSAVSNETGSFANKDFEGKVDIQIKGVAVADHKTKIVSYPLKVSTLKAIHKLGGALLIVIAMNRENLRKGRPYYAYLYESQIRQLLRKARAGQVSKSVTLSRLPKDPDKLERFFRFARDIEKKSRFVEISNDTWDNASGFRFTTEKPLDLTRPQWLGSRGTTAITELRTDSGTYIPADLAILVTPHDYLLQPLEVEVTSETISYSNARKRRISEQEFEIALSPHLQLQFGPDDFSGRLRLQSAPDFYNFHRDLKFLHEWKKNGQIQIDGKPWRIEVNNSRALKEIDEDLRIWDDIAQAFRVLNVDTHLLDMEYFTPDVLQKLEPIVRAVLQSGNFSIDSEIPLRYPFEIGDKIIQLLLVPRESTTSWECHSFTASSFWQLAVKGSKPGEKLHAATAFELLTSEELALTVNLDLASITETYQTRVAEEDQVCFTNSTIRNLILAADNCVRRRVEFLTAAFNLGTWILDKHKDNALERINIWQIKYRLGSLEDSNRSEIRHARRAINPTEDSQKTLYASYCLLLDDNSEAIEVLEDMSTEAREQFWATPIAKLMEFSQGEYCFPADSSESCWSEYEEKVYKLQVNAKD